MKKILSILLLVFVFLLVGCSSSGISISYYGATIDIDDAGNMQIEETMVMNYPGGYNWRLWDVGYKKNHSKNPLLSELNYENDSAQIDLSSIRVTVYNKDDQDITSNVKIGLSSNNDTYYSEDSGTNERVQCYEGNYNCECILIDAREYGGFDSKMTFVYSYVINGAVTQYSDVSELNWNLFTYMEGKVKKVEVDVTMPDNMHSIEDFRVYGHGASSGEAQIVSKDLMRFTAKNVTSNNPANTSDIPSFEIRIVMPNDLFPLMQEKNKISGNLDEKIVEYETKLANETNTRYLVSKIINLVTIAVLIIMIFIIIIVYRKYDKEYISTFEGEYYRELPYSYTPAEMSYLYHMKRINTEDVTATLLDLIRKKYLTLDSFGEEMTSDDADFKIILNKDKELNDLLPHEAHLINWFINDIGDGTTVTLKQIEDYGKKSYTKAQKFESQGREFIEKVKSSASKYDFFESVAKSKITIFGLIPVGALVILYLLGSAFGITIGINVVGLVIMTFIYFIYIGSIKRRSVNGNLEYSKWKAFANFLDDFSKMEDYPMPGLIIWEEYLVYATSLKMADKVMKQLKVKLPPSEFESSEATYMSNRYYGSGFYFGSCYNRIGRSITSAKSNSISTIQSHNSSSGSGRGGGFSGGSSFGGGGGGGRSGR